MTTELIQHCVQVREVKTYIVDQQFIQRSLDPYCRVVNPNTLRQFLNDHVTPNHDYPMILTVNIRGHLYHVADIPWNLPLIAGEEMTVLYGASFTQTLCRLNNCQGGTIHQFINDRDSKNLVYLLDDYNEWVARDEGSCTRRIMNMLAKKHGLTIKWESLPDFSAQK